MERIKRFRVVDAVLEAMLDAIQNGRFTPGQKIPSERVLTQEFGVSRTALREAFQKLEQLGKITIRQGDGTYLNFPVPENLCGDINTTFNLGESGMNQYLEARESLEIAAVRLSIERVSEEDIEFLNQLVKEQASYIKDPATFTQLDFKFHHALVQAANNNIILQFWMSIAPLIQEQLSRVSTVPGMLERALKHHKRIIEAISLEEPRKAENTIREHFGSVPGDLLVKMSLAFGTKRQ